MAVFRCCLMHVALRGSQNEFKAECVAGTVMPQPGCCRHAFPISYLINVPSARIGGIGGLPLNMRIQSFNSGFAA